MKAIGINTLTSEQREEIRERLRKAKNKTTEWDAIKKEYALDGSWSTAQPQLEAEGLFDPEWNKLPFTSVDQYKNFMEEQSKLPKEDRDTQLSLISHCPIPTEGLYTDVRSFNEKAKYDRESLQKKANEAADLPSKSCLPYLYCLGFGMSWDQLRTLMEASGFDLKDDQITVQGDSGKMTLKQVKVFEDTMPDTGLISSKDEKVSVRLDEAKDENARITFGVTRETEEHLKEVETEVFKDLKYTTARKSKVREAILRLGISEFRRKREDGSLTFIVRQIQKVYDDKEF